MIANGNLSRTYATPNKAFRTSKIEDNKVNERWLVVVGGFRGITGKRSSVNQRSRHLGGALYSANWQGFYLDKGCHLFDNNSDITT